MNSPSQFMHAYDVVRHAEVWSDAFLCKTLSSSTDTESALAEHTLDKFAVSAYTTLIHIFIINVLLVIS